MSKKIVWGIVGIIVLIAVFFEGVSYGKSQTPTSATGATAYSGARGGRGAGGFGGGAGGFGGATIGQIISKDPTSITVELAAPAGSTTGTTSPVGSKIVLLDNSTKITKSVSGTVSDLAVGTNVSVTGTANMDGSISAQSVQIRPSMPATTTTPSVVQ